MKCARCGQDCKYSERSDRTCPHCKGKFAFEPRSGDKLSDAQFKACIDRVSGQGKVKWTLDHLYYEVLRTQRKKKASLVGGVISLVAGAIMLPGLEHNPVLPPILILLGIGLLINAATGASPTATMKFSDFGGLWGRWLVAYPQPDSLIVRPKQEGTPRKLESDLSDYSFDRAVICDRARTVDLLLANNFHFENNCAILTHDGYPQTAFDTVRAMLKRNPNLQVFVLHDADVLGCQIARKVAMDSEWFDGKVRVVDVGLHPRQAKPFKGLLQPAQGQAPAIPGLTADELKWLGLYSLELAAVRPEQVIKRLYRAMSSPTPDTPDTSGTGDGGSDFVTDDSSFGTDAAASDGGGDSFG